MKKLIRQILSRERLARDYMLATLAALTGTAILHAIYRYQHGLSSIEDIIAALAFALILVNCLLLPWICERLDRALHRDSSEFSNAHDQPASLSGNAPPVNILQSAPGTVTLRRNVPLSRPLAL